MTDYEVKPLPYEFCQNCQFNGCYPWNRNPMLLCTEMGGFLPAIKETTPNGGIICHIFKPVTDYFWELWILDQKRESVDIEKMRLKAMKGKVRTNQLLPAEYISEKTCGKR